MNDDECSNMVVMYIEVYQAERARTEDQLQHVNTQLHQQSTELQQTRTQLQQNNRHLQRKDAELSGVQQILQVNMSLTFVCTFYRHG